MNTIDWSKAPIWAKRHGHVGSTADPIWIDDFRYQYVDGRQLEAEFSFKTCEGFKENEIFGLTDRPSKWNGEGLPPVGTVCEIAASTEYLKIRHPEGAKVKVYANFTDDRGIELAAFVDEAGQLGGVCTAKCFRPIRTPEQIAAEQVSKQLDSDLAMYGTSFSITNDDGSITRLDPTRIVMRMQEAK